MSCKHGNHTEACDLCDDLNAEYQSGYAEATKKMQAEISRLTEQRDALLAELKSYVAASPVYSASARAIIEEIEGHNKSAKDE